MKRLNSEQGFTLIEVMIAMFILTIGILSMYTMQITSIKGNATANMLSGATNIVSDRIERIFAMDYDDLKDDENADGTAGTADGLAGLQDDTDATADAKDPSPPAGYEIYWNVAENKPMDLTKTVSVIVKRSDMGETKRVNYQYVKAWAVKK